MVFEHFPLTYRPTQHSTVHIVNKRYLNYSKQFPNGILTFGSLCKGQKPPTRGCDTSYTHAGLFPRHPPTFERCTDGRSSWDR